jgi:glycosyltransferase involved in cell wall biosynthesis
LAVALASAPPGASLFVLDADSDDATVAIASAAGATVERRPWFGFVSARHYALAQVRTDWTLMLDADEALDPELRAAIAAAPTDADAYLIRRITHFCGRPIRTAGWSNEKLIRLFRSRSIRLEARSVAGADIHERWLSDGRVGELGGAIIHDSYPTVASYRTKFARYTSIEAAAVRGSASGVIAAGVLGLARFPWALLRWGGWNDGWRGLFIAASSAAYPFVVQCKALRRK